MIANDNILSKFRRIFSQIIDNFLFDSITPYGSNYWLSPDLLCFHQYNLSSNSCTNRTYIFLSDSIKWIIHYSLDLFSYCLLRLYLNQQSGSLANELRISSCPPIKSAICASCKLLPFLWHYLYRKRTWQKTKIFVCPCIYSRILADYQTYLHIQNINQLSDSVDN